jgi:hypothetical protein
MVFVCSPYILHSIPALVTEMRGHDTDIRENSSGQTPPMFGCIQLHLPSKPFQRV